MDDIFRIFKFEFLKDVKTRAYVISTIVMAVFIIGLGFFVRFMIGSEMKEKAESPSSIGLVTDLEKADLDEIFDDYIVFSSEEEINQAIEDDQIDYGMVIRDLDDVKILVNRVNPSKLMGGYTQPLKDYLVNQELAKSDLSLTKIDQMKKDLVIKEEVVAMQETNALAIGASFISIILIFILIMGSGQSIATAITNEKADRTMEILLTSTSPNSLIHGKVLASLASSLIQVAVMGLASLIAFFINMDVMLMGQSPQMVSQVPDMDPQAVLEAAKNMNISLEPQTLIFIIFFFITGYFLYVYIYAALGATANKTEELSTAIMPITIMGMLIYFAALMSISNPDGPILRVLSFIPFSSPFVAGIRYVLTDMSLLELGISYGLLLLTCLIFVRLSVKLYRMSSLNYGNTSVRSYLKALFTKA